MDPAVAGTPAASHIFQDGLGERRRIADATGDPIELLCLRRQLTSVPSFEFALRERTGRLANFRHTYFGRVRSIDRLNDSTKTLAVVSDYTKGVRLSQLLSAADPRPVTIDINAALHLIRQLVSAVAMLHENAPDIAHGAIGPERVLVTSNARVVILEYVLGAALEQVHYTPERYWKELRIALPVSAEEPRFDHRADVTQIGVVALSLILGRMLTDDEYPGRISDVLASACAISGRGGLEPLPKGLRAWLSRALQIDPRHSFASAIDASLELDKVLDGEDEGDYESLTEASVDTVAPPAEVAQPTVVPAERERDRTGPAHAGHHQAADVVKAGHHQAGQSVQGERGEPGEPAETKGGPQTAKAGHPQEAPAKPTPAPQVARPVAPNADVWEPYAAAAVTREPAPVVTPPSPKLVATPPEAKSVVTPKPIAPESRPVTSVSEPQPVAAAESKPIAAAESKLVVPEPKPSIIAPEPKPFAAVPEWHQPIPPSVVPLGAAIDDEEAQETHAIAAAASSDRSTRMIAAAAALVVLSVAVLFGAHFFFSSSAPSVTTGQVSLTTNPAGAQVFVDKEARGMTPVTLTLMAGPHVVELQGTTGEPHSIPITIEASARTSEHVELLPAMAAAAGALQIRTEPAGARVTVDGTARGRSPVLVENLAPGEHSVVLESDLGTVKHTATVQPATTASLVVPMAAAESAPASGWVSLAAPVELQLYENKRFLGTSGSDRITVSAGRHEIEVVNEALGYRARTVVQVPPGKVTPIRLEWPKGTVALNANPWAEVWIDGEKSGETPIGNLLLSIGQHDVVFRHPDLGEQRHVVTVTMTAPARLSVDMRKRP